MKLNNKVFIWAFSLTLYSMQVKAKNLNNLRLQRGSHNVEQLKKEYIQKRAAKDAAKADGKKVALVQDNGQPKPKPEGCPSPLPTPKKKCISAKRVLTNQLCAENANIDTLAVKDDATVGGNLDVAGTITAQDVSVKGTLEVNGSLKAGDVSINRVTADRADFNVETAQVSYEDVNVIEDLRNWQAEQFVNPDYDRFPNGALPQTTKIAPGEVYEYTSLSPLFVPVSGDNWNSIVHGIIDFNTATDKEKLDFYSGAHNRLFALVQGRPFSATEQQIKEGYFMGTTVMPADQQKFAAQAMDEILKGLLLINEANLKEADKVTLFNLITQCRFYSIAWKAGNTWTDAIGAEYFGSANLSDRSAYLYNAAWFTPFVNVALLTAYGLDSDGASLVTDARSLPGMYKLLPKVVKNWLDVAREGLKQGFYPHVLRNRPYTSYQESTFGEIEYGYPANIANLVSTGNFPAYNDSRQLAQIDYDRLLNASFEDQLSPNLLYVGTFTIEGLNPLPFLESLVDQGVMDQTEADYLQEEARKTYDSVKAAYLELLSTFYLDDNSPFVRALRLTRFDDKPGEWGYKFKVNDQGEVEGLVQDGPYTGQTVFIDPLGEEVVIKDANGNVIDVSLQNIELQRDIPSGEEHYTNMIEIVLKLNRDTPIPYYQKVSTIPNVNPFENWRVAFDTSDTTLPQKLNASGETLTEFFTEQMVYYLDQWNPNWMNEYSDINEAVKAANHAGRLISDLEDPAGGGIYAFVQHYQPKEDENGPLYDYSIIEGYYTEAWDGVPQLKLDANGRIDGPVLYDRDGNVLYDPQTSLGPDGVIDIVKLQEASVLDSDKADYYKYLSSIDIVEGKSARVFYFFYDFIKHSWEDFMTIGLNPLLDFYFSPYIVDAFNKLAAHRYLNSTYASSSSYNPSSEIITYIHLLDYSDPRFVSIGTRTTILHEFIMGHAIQVPIGQMINSTGTGSWLAGWVSNSATAEGWAVFIETFFGPLYTSYLSAVDRYFNYTDPTGKPDPLTEIGSIADTSRVAARLTWDTALHSAAVKETTMAEYVKGFNADTFGFYSITDEVTQRIPVGPTQALNYGLGFMQIVGLYQSLPDVLGQARYDELQANGNKATKYFFDFLLIDANGYFISSLQPLFDDWAARVRDGIAPFDNPDYDGYPVDAFDAHTVPYVPGTTPSVYEYVNNPYVEGGFKFTFPTCPIPNDGTCPLPTGN